MEDDENRFGYDVTKLGQDRPRKRTDSTASLNKLACSSRNNSITGINNTGSTPSTVCQTSLQLFKMPFSRKEAVQLTPMLVSPAAEGLQARQVRQEQERAFRGRPWPRLEPARTTRRFLRPRLLPILREPVHRPAHQNILLFKAKIFIKKFKWRKLDEKNFKFNQKLDSRNSKVSQKKKLKR